VEIMFLAATIHELLKGQQLMLNIIINLKEEQRKLHQLVLRLIEAEQVIWEIKLLILPILPCPFFIDQIEEIFRCTLGDITNKKQKAIFVNKALSAAALEMKPT
jgi:hypothetical protein